jgi:aminoglycoside phosphotransferase family enzyme/predicted kinase
MDPTIASPEPQTFTLVDALRDRLRADTGQPVELQETHISWVLLTDRLAYKLKKPLRLPFVDFSTLALRKHFCEEEVRLNRRLAPSLYQGVVTVRGTVQAPYIGAVGGPGDADTPIDYAVCMQRFAPGALLSEQLAAGTLLPVHLERLARRLADFHRDASAAPPATPDDAAQQAVQPVLDVLAQLQTGGDSPFFKEVSAWVHAQMPVLQKAWSARRQSDSVRECHGDLHLANAVLINDEVTAFDCLEFDPALRWIDVMSDVAFLTMDLKAHGRSDLAYGFLDAYLQRSGDYAGVQVLRFYEVYRALVRALVAQVRGQVTGIVSPPASPDYLACARQLALTAGGPARLLITHGLSGSGKSTVAGRLLTVAGAIRLRSDVERKRLFGLDALQRSAGLDLDIYTPEANRLTFDRLRACARTALLAGYPVIVDAAFLRRAERRAFQALAAELGVPFTLLHCHASQAQLRQRLSARQRSGNDASEADVKVLDHQVAGQEPLDDDERAMALDLVTDDAVDIAALRARWLLQV